MSDRDAANRNGDGSRIATNRAAVAIAVGSVLVTVGLAFLAQRGVLDPVLEFLLARGIAVDTLPIYLLFALLLCWLVVWSWGRLASLFQ